jgi:predicted nucleotidyltransferase
MVMLTDINNIEQQLRLFAGTCEEINALYLFGSVLRRPNPGDIDIAVLIDEKKTGLIRNISPIKSDIAALLRRDDVDLVVLNQASPIFCMQIFRTGKIIFSRNNPRVAEFRVRAMGRYHDLKMIRKPIEQQILRGRIYG